MRENKSNNKAENRVNKEDLLDQVSGSGDNDRGVVAEKRSFLSSPPPPRDEATTAATRPEFPTRVACV
ncbi:hypothetical protein F2Q69_00044262 [Brassica cretica]|uniref:Uncharacterized protein n=1 Tax=Brassica cretica TaxID=69181 RepID=A0A8S9NDB2_BRACR|nr:hypothetical protein F2Q69_00044262 [Brassica cretica]